MLPYGIARSLRPSPYLKEPQMLLGPCRTDWELLGCVRSVKLRMDDGWEKLLSLNVTELASSTKARPAASSDEKSDAVECSLGIR